MPAAHVCNHCGAEHPSRNALFRHLSERCDPTAPAGPPNERIALAVSYIGSGFHGAKQSAEEDEVTRPTVAGAVLRAARCAWGASVVSDAVPACDTERATHACENLLVLSVARGAAKDEAALRAALPPELTLLAPPWRVPEGSTSVGRHGVKRQVVEYLLPYSVLLPPSPAAEAVATGADGEDAAGGGGGEDDEEETCGVWVSSLPAACTAGEVAALVRRACEPASCV